MNDCSGGGCRCSGKNDGQVNETGGEQQNKASANKTKYR
jgi:hypothetical protein